MTRYLVRDAGEADLDALAGFEAGIALASFGADAITDPGLHRRRIGGALGKPGEIALVAAAAALPAVPLGWAWMSGRTNSLTGARYGNFRSLAVADIPDRAAIGELLMTAILRAADDAGFTQLTGKVHAANVGMRTLYRAFGFTATHITMERRAGGAAEAARGGSHGDGSAGPTAGPVPGAADGPAAPGAAAGPPAAPGAAAGPPAADDRP